MEKSEFQRLLQKYLNGQCSDEEAKLLEQWFQRIGDPSLNLSEAEKAEIGEKINSNLWNKLHKRPKEVFFVPLIRKYGMAAAIVLAIAVVTWGIYDRKMLFPAEQQVSMAAQELKVHENKTSLTERLLLPDGSVVMLEPGSSIQFGESGVTKREVTLMGEAFFDVVKDAERPFYVYGNAVVTKVLGTSFTVRSPLNTTTIEVEVKTGRVSVYKDQETVDTTTKRPVVNGVILTPNQKVTYFIREDHWVTSLVEEPEPVHAEEQATLMVFDNTPLHEIATRLEQEYGIEMVIVNEKVTACTFTGDVTELSLYNKLGVIIKSIGATYEIQGTTILIDGKGCD